MAEKKKKTSKSVSVSTRKPVRKVTVKAKTKVKVSAKTAPVVKKVSRKPAVVETKLQHVRIVPISLEARRARLSNSEPQFAYMKAPGIEHAFEVGDTVEVYCDHEKNNDRIRGWIRGIVVQVDNKMVAVQFRSNVFLTDGWMVPDRILWYPLTSDQIRSVAGKKSVKRDLIPEY